MEAKAAAEVEVLGERNDAEEAMNDQIERRVGMTELKEDISEIKDDVKEIKDKFQKVIYGNDEPGLKVKIDRNTSFREKQEKDQVEKKRRSWHLIAAVIIAFLNGGIAIAIAIVKAGG